MRVAHVITGLGTGGAEIMLWRLLSALDTREFETRVISLAPEGPVAERIRRLGVDVVSLDLPPDVSALLGVIPLWKRLSAWSPDVIQTWMYHADFLGSVAAVLLRRPVIWSLHHATLDGLTPRQERLVRTLSHMSSRVPARVVSCSRTARRVHEEAGYDGTRLMVIPNGFDISEFKADPAQRESARAAWGVAPCEFVVGHVGRFHPDKDHHTFIQAASLALRDNPRLRFVLYGKGVNLENEALVRQLRETGIEARCSLRGPEPDISKVMPGLDLLVSSSRAEAFPLVVGEAMACSVPCVVTDVGDSAWLVGDTGAVVPPADARALAQAIVALAGLTPSERDVRGKRASARIANDFALPSIAARYADVYREASLMRAPNLLPRALMARARRD